MEANNEKTGVVPQDPCGASRGRGIQSAGVAVGHADTDQLVIDNCTGGCNPGSPGTSMGTVVRTPGATCPESRPCHGNPRFPATLCKYRSSRNNHWNLTGEPTIALVASTIRHVFGRWSFNHQQAGAFTKTASKISCTRSQYQVTVLAVRCGSCDFRY